MKLQHLLITALALSLSLFACQSDSSGGDGSAEGATADSTGMAQFADDENFQNAHDEPGEADAQNSGNMMEFPTPDGNTASAYTLMPETPTDKYLFIFHEWWGLNDHIKQEAERYFEELDSVNVMALDLYDGKMAEERKQASELMESVNEERIRAIIQGAIDKAGDDAEIATVGWCFGGGWSLKASIMAGEQGEACVMYYGMPVEEQSALQPLEAPILAHFAMQDDWVTPAVANSFKLIVGAAGKTMQMQMYNAEHAFANPSQISYDAQAAKRANMSTMAFLKDKLLDAKAQ
ncbi:MAG TPA: dienelactone hydrolase family protein [Phaeodactylibacter sp.]|nr:dienelactone hydrolase family protein [Phaeodactylibacter sp.]